MCACGERERERDKEREREREREREPKRERERERDQTKHVRGLERCAVSQPSSESLCSSSTDNILMEVVQELLDAPRLKKPKKKKATGSAKIIVDRVT